MCGICGIYYYGSKQNVDINLLKRMNNMIAHRGPDGEGFYLDSNIGFGHRRLSIVDLANGIQPMCNEDESVWITFNGEIYNHKEYRDLLVQKGHSFKSNCDTETIIHLYEEYGVEFISKLNGMFSFAIWDKKKNSLLIVRDRLGVKPLYYYYDKDKISFASEIKSIIADEL